MKVRVPLLCSFMERNRQTMLEEVHLGKLANKYKEDTGRDPVMVVDVSNCIRVIERSSKNQFCHEQLKNMRKYLEKLINKCYEFKIKLIFLGTGLLLQDVECFEKNYQEVLTTTNPSVSALRSGVIFHVATCILKSSDKCEYIRAKCGNEILNYVKTHGCFAIFGHGSAFIIAEGAQYCLSTQHFDLDTMTTLNYNRNQLAKALGINPSQLPYFAAVFACQTMFTGKFLEVANLIKRNLNSVEKVFKMDSEKFDYHLKYLRGDLLKEEPKPVGGDWDGILCLADERHTTGVANREILTCLLHHVFYAVPKTMHESLSPGAKLLALRTRIYGILFYEYPGEIFIKDHFFPCNGTTKVEMREIFVSKIAHCGLRKLWCEDYPKDEKIGLFCRAFNSNLTPEHLNKIDIKEELLFPFLTVFYLLNEVGKELTELEWKALLIQSILTNELKEVDTNYEIGDWDGKMFELCDWFLTTVEHITLLNSVCGNPFSVEKTCMINYYEETLFHHVYRKLENGNLDEDVWTPNVCATYKKCLSGMEQLKKACGHNS